MRHADLARIGTHHGFGKLALVLLPMKHVVIVHGNLRGQDQAAGLADQHIPADLPMRAVLAFTNQKFDFLFAAHL
jgi:hypothetical protein